MPHSTSSSSSSSSLKLTLKLAIAGLIVIGINGLYLNSTKISAANEDKCEDSPREITVAANRLKGKLEECLENGYDSFSPTSKPCPSLSYNDWQRLNYMLGLNAAIEEGKVFDVGNQKTSLLKFTDFNFSTEVATFDPEYIKLKDQTTEIKDNLEAWTEGVTQKFSIQVITDLFKINRSRSDFTNSLSPSPPKQYFGEYVASDFTFPGGDNKDFTVALNKALVGCSSGVKGLSQNVSRQNALNGIAAEINEQDQQRFTEECRQREDVEELCADYPETKTVIQVVTGSQTESYDVEPKKACLEYCSNMCELEGLAAVSGGYQDMTCDTLLGVLTQMDDPNRVKPLIDNYGNKVPDWMCLTVNEKEAMGYDKELPPSKYTNEIDRESAQKEMLEDAESACAQTGFHAMVTCPLTRYLGRSTDKSFSVLRAFLAFPEEALSTHGALNQTWRQSRDIANTLLVVVGLGMIILQLTSLGSTQRIKQLLPQFIVTAILINVSFFLASVAVQAANIVGDNITGLFKSLAGEAFSPESPMTELVETALIGGLAGIVGVIAFKFFGALSLVIPLLVSALVTVLATLAVISIRQVAIVVLIFLAPLAIVASALPNTKSLSKRWTQLFTSMLLVYPVVALLFGVGDLVHKITWSVEGEFFKKILSLTFAFIPLLVAPKLIMQMVAQLPMVSGAVRKLSTGGSEAKRRFNQSGAGQAVARAGRQRRAKTKETIKRGVATTASSITSHLPKSAQRTPKQIMAHAPMLANTADYEADQAKMKELLEDSQSYEKQDGEQFIIDNLTPTASKDKQAIINQHRSTADVEEMLRNMLVAGDAGVLTESQLTTGLKIAENSGYSQEFINDFALRSANKLAGEGAHGESAKIQFRLNSPDNNGYYLEGGFDWEKQTQATVDRVTQEFLFDHPDYKIKANYSKQKDYNKEIASLNSEIPHMTDPAEIAHHTQRRDNLANEQRVFEHVVEHEPAYRKFVGRRIRTTTNMPEGKSYGLDLVDRHTPKNTP